MESDSPLCTLKFDPSEFGSRICKAKQLPENKEAAGMAGHLIHKNQYQYQTLKQEKLSLQY